MSEKLHTAQCLKGQTRNCIYPWTDVEIQDNGDIRPCCARKACCHLTNASLAKILNGDEMRKLRSSLLSGNLDHTCMNCRLQPFRSKKRPHREGEGVEARSRRATGLRCG